MKNKVTILAITLSVITMYSCFKEPLTDSLSSDLVVATNRDLQANYTSYATYHISDTIPRITSSQTDTLFFGPDALEIVNRIKSNMDANGYVFTERSESPDLVVIPSILDVTAVGQVCSGWWGGYPGFWDPWYWGYPGYGYYYPYCGYYKYEAGSLNVELFDLVNVDDNNNINAVWGSVMFGVLSSFDQTNLEKALKAVDQAFDQSPYLNK